MSLGEASRYFAASTLQTGIATLAGAAALAIRGDDSVSSFARDTLRSISQQAFVNMLDNAARGLTALAAPPMMYPLTRSERKRQRRAVANREARNRGWVTEWRKLGADPLEDRAARIEREPPEMRPWVVRQTSNNVRGALQ